MKLKFVALSLVLASAPVVAHDFWLQPQRFSVASGAVLGVTFQVGHGADRQRWGNGSDRIVQVVDISSTGRVDQRGNLRTDGQVDLVTRLTNPGLHVLAMQTVHSFSDLPALRFNDFLKEEGLVSAIAARARAGTTNKAGRERYSRRAKSLIQVGPRTAANQALATRPIGLTLEIVPERNPYALGASRRLPVHVLYRGRRLPNATVKFTDLDRDAKPLAVAVTDRAGRAVFKVPATGKYLINVIWTEPVSGDARADFDTTFSSLTFGYNR